MRPGYHDTAHERANLALLASSSTLRGGFMRHYRTGDRRHPGLRQPIRTLGSGLIPDPMWSTL